MDIRFPFSPAEVAKVRMVQFGILSPDEIVISAAMIPPLSNSQLEMRNENEIECFLFIFILCYSWSWLIGLFVCLFFRGKCLLYKSSTARRRREGSRRLEDWVTLGLELLTESWSVRLVPRVWPSALAILATWSLLSQCSILGFWKLS